MWKFVPDFEPQKARGKLQESMWESPYWIAEVKHDGERRIAQICGKVVRYTGTPSRVTGKPVEKTEQIPHLAHLPIKGVRCTPVSAALDGTVLDGELILPPEVKVKGSRSKAVTSISNSAPDVAIGKQIERGWLRYVVFDCLFFKGGDLRKLPLYQRRKAAMTAIGEWKNPFVSFIEGQQHEDKRDFLQKVYEEGGEGIILKHMDHAYGDEKLWVKEKAEITADCVIMGYKSAKEMSKKADGSISMTKYAAQGLIGAVVVGQYKSGKLVEVATVSGMTDDVRGRLTHLGKQHLGYVVEIKANGREPTGRFRHPRFRRFRDDKPAKACVFDLNEK